MLVPPLPASPRRCALARPTVRCGRLMPLRPVLHPAAVGLPDLPPRPTRRQRSSHHHHPRAAKAGRAPAHAFCEARAQGVNAHLPATALPSPCLQCKRIPCTHPGQPCACSGGGGNQQTSRAAAAPSAPPAQLAGSREACPGCESLQHTTSGWRRTTHRSLGCS